MSEHDRSTVSPPPPGALSDGTGPTALGDGTEPTAPGDSTGYADAGADVRPAEPVRGTAHTPAGHSGDGSRVDAAAREAGEDSGVTEPVDGATDAAAGHSGEGSPIWAAAAAGDDGATTIDPLAEAAPESATTARRKRRNLIIAGSAVVVLAAGVLGPLGWRYWHQKNEEVETPKQVAGLVLDNSQGARDTIDYLRTAMETAVSLDDSTGGVYEDHSSQSRSVLFIGGTGVLVSPSAALTKTFTLISDANGGVDGVHEVPAGALGGTMRCGSTKTDGGAMAVCAWADHGSIGLGMFPNRPVDQSAELLRTMRGQIQKRN